MKLEEQETTITYDYADSVVRIYTTREGVKNGIVRRLGEQEGLKVTASSSSWSIVVPMALCRSGDMIVKLLNPEERQPMSDEQKAALAAIR